ncbi:MAG: dienelactone hydrolase family protein [Anaerolineales bacterium]|nr:dienelactone hydrolase family protein [Anaerolineales bacterium]
MKILVETLFLNKIPTLQIVPVDGQHSPVIVFIPGYGGTKETGLSIGCQLARQGFFFMAFDPLYHGQRSDPRLGNSADPDLGSIYPPEMGMDTFYTMNRIIWQCLEDVRSLLKSVEDDGRADLTSCGVTGLSMGGYASYLVFANLAEMKAAVPMIGIPNFTRRWKDLLDECAFSNPDWAQAIENKASETNERTQFIEQIDPYSKLKQIAPKALLMMNCDFDTDQPKHYAIDCYRELLPAYQGNKENLKLNIYPAGHQVTPEMEDDAAAWFTRHLLGTGRDCL